MKKQKYYVVWSGKKPGIYDNWNDCEQQVGGYKAAQYISFENLQDAQIAFKQSAEKYIGTKKGNDSKKSIIPKGNPKYKDALCVDGAWNTKTGDIEYQGINLLSQKVIFHQGPYADGTNNIAEFLAIVHALAYCKQKGIDTPIYSDSRNAISWVQQKKCNTKLEQTKKNQEIFKLVGRATLWLQENSYPNKILKWDTKNWGENPADFGRK